MKFVTTTADCVKALSILSKVINARNYQPILDYALVDVSDGTISVTATNLDDTMVLRLPSLTIQSFGKIAVNPKEVLKHLKAFPKSADVLTVELENDKLRFYGGSASFLARTLPEWDFPQMPLAKGSVVTVLNPVEIATAKEKVSYCAAAFDASSILSGVHFKLTKGRGLDVISTDGSRMAVYRPERQTSDVDAEFTLPAKSVAYAVELSKYLTGKAGAALHVTAEEGSIPSLVSFSNLNGTLTSRPISQSYPQYQEIFPKTLYGYRTFKHDELLSACNAVLAESQTTHNVMVIVGSELGSKSGAFRCSLTADVSDTRSFGINAYYLKQWLGANKCDSVKIALDDARAGQGPLLLEGAQSDVRHLIMPVTIHYDIVKGEKISITGWWTALESKSSKAA